MKPVLPALLARKVLLVKPALPVRKVLPVKPALLARKVLLVKPALPVHRVQPVVF